MHHVPTRKWYDCTLPSLRPWDAISRHYGRCPSVPFVQVNKSYSIGFVMLMLMSLVTGQLASGFTAFARVPWTASYGTVLLFSASGYLGVSCVLSLVKGFGALTAVTGALPP